MQTRTFHGPITTVDLAKALVADFNRGNLRAQHFGDKHKAYVQIAKPGVSASGGRTAITVQLTAVEDGVMIQLGQQDWLGVAASLGTTALMALHRPLSLLQRIDDVAEDIDSLQLTERIWQVIDATVTGLGASLEISERLRRITCPHCQTANQVGASACIACGAPLGPSQPKACRSCGFVVPAGAQACPNCGKPV
jgi:predicted RNA-binding Zn-ribbon protein involved in translation (DUF1610 family)